MGPRPVSVVSIIRRVRRSDFVIGCYRGFMQIGSAGASPSHGTSYGREGEASADPNPSFRLNFTVSANKSPKREPPPRAGGPCYVSIP